MQGEEISTEGPMHIYCSDPFNPIEFSWQSATRGHH